MNTQDKPPTGLFRSGIIVTIVGVLITVAGIWYGGSLAASGFGSIADQNNNRTILASGSGEIQIDSRQNLQLFQTDVTVDHECAVFGPSGNQISQGRLPGSTITANGERWRSVESFRAEEVGTYRIDCVSGPIMVAPAVGFGDVLAGAGGIVIAIFVGMFGVFVILVGVVLWIVGGVLRRNWRRRREQQSTMGYPI